ncbi:MAG: hypothetical protein DWG81_00835 [Chloroflexi bacterium]|nr:hypothetical protein [Chloroflexota bacterium]
MPLTANLHAKNETRHPFHAMAASPQAGISPPADGTIAAACIVAPAAVNRCFLTKNLFRSPD